MSNDHDRPERPEKPDMVGPPAEGPDRDRDFERSEREVRAHHQHLERERVKEQMRDKTHDGRVKVSDDVSIGADSEGVNVRTTF